jgi:hypothetical protein
VFVTTCEQTAQPVCDAASQEVEVRLVHLDGRPSTTVQAPSGYRFAPIYPHPRFFNPFDLDWNHPRFLAGQWAPDGLHVGVPLADETTGELRIGASGLDGAVVAFGPPPGDGSLSYARTDGDETARFSANGSTIAYSIRTGQESPTFHIAHVDGSVDREVATLENYLTHIWNAGDDFVYDTQTTNGSTHQLFWVSADGLTRRPIYSSTSDQTAQVFGMSWVSATTAYFMGWDATQPNCCPLMGASIYSVDLSGSQAPERLIPYSDRINSTWITGVSDNGSRVTGWAEIFTDPTGTSDVAMRGWTVDLEEALPGPTITSFSPSSGPTGTFVTINGTNLLGAKSVTFGGTEASIFAVISGSQITAVVAPLSTSGPITVSTPEGAAMSGSSFTVVQQHGPVLMIHGLDARAPYGDVLDRELLTVAYYERDVNCDRPINAYVNPSLDNSYFDGVGAHAGTAGGHTAEAAIEHLGYHLAWFVYSEYSSQGRYVDILSHSMGGLIARYALAEVASANPAFPPRLLVSNVVTLGTPHGGARTGARALCRPVRLGLRQCIEMEAGSQFLTSLEENGWNPQGTGGTDWTVMGSDDDTWVAADRAVGTSRDRQTNLYFGACHKLWYPSVRFEGKRKIKQGIEHDGYMHNGSIVGGMNATNLAAHTSGDHCGAPLESATGQRHPMGQATLALTSTEY